MFVALGSAIVSGAALAALAVAAGSTYVPVAGGTYVEGAVGQPIMVNPIVSTNPVDQDLGALLYAPLSSLLTGYDVSTDTLHYTLKIKEGLTWDDGQPLTSDDVLFTLQTVEDPEAHSPFAKAWEGVQAERVSSIQVRLSLPTPYVFLGEDLKRLPIIPKHIFGAIPIQNLRLSTYNLEPVGDGPYRFHDYQKRKDGFITRYTLVPNENYAGPHPYIQTFAFQFYERASDLQEGLLTRQVQGYGSLTPLSSDFTSIAHTVTESYPMPRSYMLFLNPVANPFLKDRNARYALADALDKATITRDASGGAGTVVDSPFFPSLIQSMVDPGETGFGSVDLSQSSRYPYDPTQASQLVQGLKEGDVTITLSVPQVDFLERAAAEVKTAWEAIGIKSVNIVTLDPTALEEALQSRSYEVLLFGDVLENPLDLFPFWHSSERFYPGLNLALYQNLDADKLMEDLRQSPDRSTDASRVAQLDGILTSDLPAIPLFTLPYEYLHTDRLGGFTTNPVVVPADRFQNVSQWYIAKARVLK